MTVSLHAFAPLTFAPLLRTLSGLIDKAAEQARAEGRDPDALVEARLAPDMLPLAFQVGFACQQAADGTARLTGAEVSKFQGGEKTLAELKARIERTVAYVEAADPAAFAGAEDREIRFPLIEDLSVEMNGLQYLRDWTLAQFYFHLVTAYDILRNQGAQLGKQDYMAHIGYAIRRGGG